MISFRNVTKKYSKEVALQDVSFDIEKGEFVFLTGVSGSGKTTLIKLLYKEILPSAGSIQIFGKDMLKTKEKKLRRRMGIVFQNYELLKNKTVLENVAYPLACLGMFPTKVKREALYALEKLNMCEYAKKMPNELSGGQQQRVAIARAIVNCPDLLICDEPTGNLDSENTRIIMEHLEMLNQLGTTVVMSTHSEEIIREMKKRVIHLDKGIMLSDGSVKDTSSFDYLDSFKFEEEEIQQNNMESMKTEIGQKKKEILKQLGWNEKEEKGSEVKMGGGK